MVFGDQFHSVSIMFSRTTHIVICIRAFFLFIVEYMDSHIYRDRGRETGKGRGSFLLLGVELLIHIVTMLRISQTFPKWLDYFISSPEIHEDSSSPCDYT